MMPTVSSFISRARGKARRTMARHLHRRDLQVGGTVPLVSFTFDDAPRTAFDAGGTILEAHGVRGTYYVSLGLMSTTSEIGLIGEPRDLVNAVEHGHELGCHTFHHLDAWYTDKGTYIASVDRNRSTLQELLPGYVFRSFAYPKSGATARVKPALEQRFESCRGGGQTFNIGVTDLNMLSACFVDRRARVDLDLACELIERNKEAGGWLIFAAHDISQTESAFGCTRAFFEAIVRRAVDSESLVLPVSAAGDYLRQSAAK